MESYIAQRLYEANCASKGGKDIHGNPLPSWADLVNNEKKQAVVEVWLEAARRSSLGAKPTRQPAIGGWD